MTAYTVGTGVSDPVGMIALVAGNRVAGRGTIGVAIFIIMVDAADGSRIHVSIIEIMAVRTVIYSRVKLWIGIGSTFSYGSVTVNAKGSVAYFVGGRSIRTAGMAVITGTKMDFLDHVIVGCCMTVNTVGVPAKSVGIMVAVHRIRGKCVDFVLMTILAVSLVACRKSCVGNDLLDRGSILGTDGRVGTDVPGGVVTGDAGA
jgi:hypothetical protein